MKEPTRPLTPNLFESLILRQPRFLTAFICSVILVLTGFNLYCLSIGRFGASVALSVLLIGLLVILLIFRFSGSVRLKVIAIRYGLGGLVLFFGAYLLVTIGFLHQTELSPWSYLMVFMAFLLFPDKKGGLISGGFILLLLYLMVWTDIGQVKENFDFLLRYFISLILFALMSLISALFRNSYLNNLAQTRKAYREQSENLLAEIRRRDKMEKKLHEAIKMETLGKVAAGVAHDLNNILSGIVTYPDFLLLDMDESHPKRKFLEQIRNSGIKAAAIVEDLLTLTRRGVTISEPVNLRKVVEDYLTSPEHTKLVNYHPHIRITAHYGPEARMINGSFIHLSKAVMNLISNAAESMPDGGNISIRVYHQVVDPSFVDRPEQMPDGDYSVLSVADTGIGIEAEDIDKIFEPFFTKKKMGRSGTGLGMAVVLGTVKDHHAFIDVKSTVKKGTVITLFFPVSEEAADETETPETEEKGSYLGNHEKILVIDDLAEQCEIAMNILSRLGYDSASCQSGEAAVERLKKEDFDLLVIDMVMTPGIDGLETYKRILSFKPDQKAIFATGFSEHEKLKDAVELSRESHLSKPYTIGNIGCRIKDVFSG